MTPRDLLSHLVRPRTRARLVRLEHEIVRPLGQIGLGRYTRPLLLRRYAARPWEVDIEVTSGCDADCIMCPRRKMRRHPGPMDLALFKKIVDEAVELGVRQLCLNGYGEISTLRNAREYLAYIREKSRWIKIIINTNGMRMSEELSRSYVNMAVNVVNIAIDGATAATYEGIRRDLRLDVVEGNVKRLIEIRNASGKRHPLVMVQMILMPQNEDEVALFRRKWHGVADHVGLSGLVSRLGSIRIGGIDRGWQRTPCFLLWSQMPILSDGTVALCCDDWDGQGNLGNVRETSIKAIWTSPERQRLQSVHLAGSGSAIPLCARCRQPREGPWWFPREVPVQRIPHGRATPS